MYHLIKRYEIICNTKEKQQRVLILIEQLALGTEKERVGITDKPAIINLNFKPTFELKLSRKCNNIKLGS